MITIGDKIIKTQKKFWNSCVFHPTDAVEDPWGKKILDTMAKDKAIDTVRIYAMFEDIVYTDEDGKLSYDFRINDLRLDYLVEKGYRILIAYGMMPECLASNPGELSNVSKNKTRYKGKMLFTSKPKDIALWEEICREYTRHIVDRYGEETVSKWYLHCYNEPDCSMFFMKEIPENDWMIRLDEYFKMYRGFASGVLDISDKLFIGGPALANNLHFLDGFLKKIREENLRLDYIAVHNYAGTGSNNAQEKGFSVENWIEKHLEYVNTLKNNGFENTPLLYDEWGMAGHGFLNIDECPIFIARENEVYSSYYVKLIGEIVKNNYKIESLMICLSGQHEMTVDFSGFRNFFTMNFFAKPIYNAHILASKLKSGILESKCDNKNVTVIPTKSENNEYAVLLTYCDSAFSENLPETEEELVFEHLPDNSVITLYCIDKDRTNPYRMYERRRLTSKLSEEEIRMLRDEGKIKPVATFSSKDKIKLQMSANCVYMAISRLCDRQ